MTKAELIAQARASKPGGAQQGKAQPARPTQPAQNAPQAGQVPTAVRKAVAPAQSAPQAAPAPQQPARRGPVAVPPQRPAAQDEQVEGPKLDVNEVGNMLRRIAKAFGGTAMFQGAPVIVTFEVSNDPRVTLGVSVTEAIPGTMHPRFMADGAELRDATSKLMRRFRQGPG